MKPKITNLLALLESDPQQGIRDAGKELRAYIESLEGEAKYHSDVLGDENNFEKRVEPIPSYGNLYTIEDFQEMVEDGVFTPDDGSGFFANEHLMSHVDAAPMLPFHVPTAPNVFPNGFTHVMWFNK